MDSIVHDPTMHESTIVSDINITGKKCIVFFTTLKVALYAFDIGDDSTMNDTNVYFLVIDRKVYYFTASSILRDNKEPLKQDFMFEQS